MTGDDAAVEIPEGALSDATKIAVTDSDVEVAAPEGYELAGPAIAFTPHGLSFDDDVTLTLPYASSASVLAVLRLDDEDDDSWEVVDGGTFARGVATLDVNHFSIYAVAAEVESPEGMGGTSGSGGAPPATEGGMSGASESGGAPAAVGGAPAAGGDLSFSCDNRDDAQLPLCTDHFYPALVVNLAGITPSCPEGAVLGEGCDTTDAVIGCLAKDADGLPGVNVTNWFYTGTAEDIMNGVLCSEDGIEFVEPP